MSVADYLTLVAIVTGPILGVLTAVVLEARRLRKQRQLAVFTALMRTRWSTTSLEHVNAINLIEVEFHGKKNIIESYRKLMESLEEQPRLDSEKIDLPDLNSDDKAARENAYNHRVFNNYQEAMAVLLFEISKTVGKKFDKNDIKKVTYLPKSWKNLDDEVQLIRKYVISLSKGQAYVPMCDHTTATMAAYELYKKENIEKLNQSTS